MSSPHIPVSRSAPAPPHSIQRVRTAPARVNLIGEHTDYTGGYVLPIAIPFYTQATIAPSSDGNFTLRSTLFPEVRTLTPATLLQPSRDWSDYSVGVLDQLRSLQIDVPPFVMELSGNVPFGAGLSSSASIEVASCLAMLALAGQSLSAAQISLLCQRAENQFVGSPCGVMDQFAVTAAKDGHALLLNTRDLSFNLIPMNIGDLRDACIVVCNSMVRHSIADGSYGDRRVEVEAGQQILRQVYPEIRDLGDATLKQLEQTASRMPAESLKRCRHIISENLRVLRARDILLAGDAVELGKIMLRAHESQKVDFECSCDEIDFLVDTAASLPGCFGARMTGGGFGGCTVNLVKCGAVDEFRTALRHSYHQRFGVTAETYLCTAVDGAMELQAEAALTETL